MTPGKLMDVVVIGGGQAGLALSRQLGLEGIDHEILERDRVGSAWATLWDSFHLNTPNWSVQLPGQPYDGREPDGFMARDEIVATLRRYAATREALIREGVSVTSIGPRDGGFELSTSEGPLLARCVVVCSGAYQTTFRPPGTTSLPTHLVTVDTRTYRNPASLPDGAVLVIGSGQSGCQIAEDLIDAGREVVLSCGQAAWAPRRVGDHDLFWWVTETGFLDKSIEDLPSPAARFAATVTASGIDGGHDLHPRTLRAKGVQLVGRFLGADADRLRFADDLGQSIAWSDDRYRDFVRDVETLCRERGMPRPDLPDPEPFDPAAPTSMHASGLGAVVSAGGFRPDYSWVHAARAFDEMGFPIQRDGASTSWPGLFFAGVHFLRTRRSSLLCGVGDDAAVVAAGVAKHLGVARA